ncbi:MAG: hypothetical protein WA077_01365, partial [Anaerolineae bacterium]
AVVIPTCRAFSARRAGAGSIVDAGRRASPQRPAGRDPNAGALADKDAHILMILIRGMDDNGVAVGRRRCLAAKSCAAVSANWPAFQPALFLSFFVFVAAVSTAGWSFYDVCHCRVCVNTLR